MSTSAPAYSAPRRDSDNISIISAAPSYRTTFEDTQLIAPSFRSYRTTTTPSTLRPLGPSRSNSSSSNMNLNVYSIPGFQNFNLPRNEEALHKIASRRQSERLERTLRQFSINYEREQVGRGSSASHPMLAPTRAPIPSSLGVAEVTDGRCPLEIDNEVWDYGFMCHGSYPSLQYYQTRAMEITRYSEKEEAIKLAHERHCVQRSV